MMQAYPGCQTGTCRFVDNEGEAAQKAKCRFDFFQVAGGETVILLHPPPPSVGVSIGMERGVSVK